jgi:hypothetical protein
MGVKNNGALFRRHGPLFDGPALRNGKTLTKKRLRHIIAELFIWGPKDPRAKQILEVILETMKEALARRESVTIKGFGSFRVTKRHTSLPPPLNYEMDYYWVKFMPSEPLQKMVNGAVENDEQ